MSSTKPSAYKYQIAAKMTPAPKLPIANKEKLPLLVIQENVLFPGHSLLLTSTENLEIPDAQSENGGVRKIGVISDFQPEKGSHKNIGAVGTEAFLASVVKLQTGGLGAIVRGHRRFYLDDIKNTNGKLSGNVSFFQEKAVKRTAQSLASSKALKALIIKALKLSKDIPQDSATIMFNSDDPALLCDLIAPHLSLNFQEKLKLLGTFDLKARIKEVTKLLTKEVELLQISSKIQNDVKDDMQDSIRRNFLKEQMVAIKKELGDIEGDEYEETEELEKQLSELPLPKQIREASNKELDRLQLMTPASPEYMLSINYLNLIKDLPWAENKEDNKVPSLAMAKRNINSKHYGLEKVKDRILEHLAIIHHKKTVKGQILLLLGPPGVGKTSLAKTIAKSLKRKFARVSLGGVKDEAEIRGHRRTYIGAMPGKILQAMKETGTVAPVLLLDEIDKTGTDGRADLSSALLELLDYEQNNNFTDHYLSLPYDMSKVLFIATANSTHGMDPALLDRMEIIELSGYTENEKVNIAQKHLVSEIRKDLELEQSKFNPNENTIKLIIRHYTREAGVRQLKENYLELLERSFEPMFLKVNLDLRLIQTALSNF